MKQFGLVIVANTLPVRRVESGGRPKWVRSPGGLVSALGPIAREREGAWVGWTGERDAKRRPFTNDGIRNVPVSVSSTEAEGSYDGVCNRTLWPLYHDAVRQPEYHRHWWRSYVTLNERFTRDAMRVAAEGATVWVHDYHLQLVPSMLRRQRPDLQIGFFLHIPFPPEELFMRLPWRRLVLDGLLGADVIGFQTKSDRQNFVRVATRLDEVRTSGRRLLVGKRSIVVDAYPISINTEQFETHAKRPDVQAEARELRRRLGGDRRVLLGVDRLDYTKGIDLRLRGFEQLLRNRRSHAEDTVLVQVAVPSRERIFEYQELRRQVEELVGQINGRYAQVGSAVVHYLRRNLPQEELVAMYLAADVMLVTPLRDGMNLVAKEYIASRIDESGALILSEFAGAAAELSAANLVNPHDVDGMAEAMERALAMPKSERRRRMRAMRRVVQRHTVHAWAKKFLGDLGKRSPSR